MILPQWVKAETLLREFCIHPFLDLGPWFTGHRFTPRLIFPRWDVIVIILSIFLLTYTYIEAKANYHRGSILVSR